MRNHSPIHGPRTRESLMRRCARVACLLAVFVLLPVTGFSCWASQAAAGAQEPPLPDAPQPLLPARIKVPPASACQTRRTAVAVVQAGVAGALASDPRNPALSPSLQQEACPPLAPLVDWYARFLNGPQVRRLTPTQKAWLATRDVIDPFNAITILGNSAIYVGANSHSAYGPGMIGFGKNVGVSYAQDVTGEFFGTFLIPALVHQDPHFYRCPMPA